MRSHIPSVLRYSKDQARPRVVQPWHAYKVQTGVAGHAASLDRISVCIKNGKSHQTEVEGISRRPNYAFDVGLPQVKLVSLRLFKARGKLRQDFLRNNHSVFFDV